MIRSNAPTRRSAAPLLVLLASVAPVHGQTPPAAAPTPQDPPVAETEGSRVVVTARKWEEAERDVPQSLSTLRYDELLERGAETITEAARSVPNTLITGFTSRRLSFPYVRGVGSGQGDPAVTTFVDGVPQLSVSSTNLPLWDVERVEFLRGPSSALYGRNTVGGAIHLHSRRPTNRTELEALTTIGNFGREEFRAGLSTPLVADELYLRLSVSHENRDGYTTNALTGNDVDDRDSWFGHGQLVWTPDAHNTLRYTIWGEAARDGGFVLSELNGLRAAPNRIAQDFEGSADRDVLANTLHYTHSGSDLELTSITAVQDWSIEESADFDFSPIDGVRRFTQEEQTYLYQEVRVGSRGERGVQFSERTALRWLVGISGFYSDSERAATNEFRAGGAGILFPPGQVGSDTAAGTFDDWGLAGFGQATLSAGQLELSGALRFDYEDKEAELQRTFSGFPLSASAPSRSDREWLPRVSLAYRLTDEFSAYGLAARGFKAGGFNTTAPAGRTAFGTETSWTYELGLKAGSEAHRVEGSVAVFHIDWDDMQLSQFDPTAGGYVTNAGESTSRGVEFECVLRPTEQIEVYGSLGFLDTEFDAFVDQFGQNTAGNDLPFAPERTASVGARYSTPIGEHGHAVFARADYHSIGRFYYDASNLQSERYELLNLRIGGGGERWRIEGFMENALDERYVPIAFQINPADPTLFAGESAGPRTYGVTVRLSW